MHSLSLIRVFVVRMKKMKNLASLAIQNAPGDDSGYKTFFMLNSAEAWKIILLINLKILTIF